jgi:hypothetical protein
MDSTALIAPKVAEELLTSLRGSKKGLGERLSANKIMISGVQLFI